jgi:hypothetical protein
MGSPTGRSASLPQVTPPICFWSNLPASELHQACLSSLWRLPDSPVHGMVIVTVCCQPSSCAAGSASCCAAGCKQQGTSHNVLGTRHSSAGAHRARLDKLERLAGGPVLCQVPLHRLPLQRQVTLAAHQHAADGPAASQGRGQRLDSWKRRPALEPSLAEMCAAAELRRAQQSWSQSPCIARCCTCRPLHVHSPRH